jgi:hypothetical protein
MQKKYIVRLTEEEGQHLEETIKKLKGSGQKVRRAQILLKADADGANWTDCQIAEAFNCRTKTVENIRQQVGTARFSAGIRGQATGTPAYPQITGRRTGSEDYRLAPKPAACGLCQLVIAPTHPPCH